MRRFSHLLFGKGPVVLLIFYIFLSFVLMNFNRPGALRGIRLGLLAAVSGIHTIQQKLTYLQNLKAENDALRKEIFKLKVINQELGEALLENIRLKRLLGLKDTARYHLIAARVIGEGTERGVRSIILNAGTIEGVRKNCPVINADGLVGRVLITEPHHAIVQILLDYNSLVSARLQHSREVGTIAWSGNPWLELRYIAKNVQVSPGEAVITSGLSPIYPPGIKIGVVQKVRENKLEFFKEIRVRPAVNFNALEEVFILCPDSTENAVVLSNE